MSGYECIFRFFVDCQPSRCWLRLYAPTHNRIVAILSEVPGNLGYTVTDGIERLALEVVARFHLRPEQVIWIEHHPPDAHGEATGTYECVGLQWSVRRVWLPGESRGYFHSPQWQYLSHTEAERLPGVSFPEHPFWTYQPHTRHTQMYWVRVAGRLGQLWPSPERAGWWRALVEGRSHEFTAHAPQEYPLRHGAQQWVLDTLANLALEFDDLPPWLQEKRAT